MTITLQDLDFLTSNSGETLLKSLSQENLSEKNTLKLITKYRKKYNADEVSAALSLARLREKAVAKFGADASKLYLTDDALQQASDPLIRAYRAKSVSGRIYDMCCGIGTDSLAFARAGASVVGVDIDPVRIAMAHLNAEALGLDVDFVVDDVIQHQLNEPDLIFFDPARRTAQGNRIYNVEQYLPPLTVMAYWHDVPIMAKISPGVDLDQLAGYGGQVEFISVDGDLKEAVLHQNSDKDGLLATLLVGDAIHHYSREGEEPHIVITEPQSWLCEPDPAILRANLVKDLAADLNGTMIDETIAYIITDEMPNNIWVRAWRIRDWMPFNLKKLRAYLRERNIGILTVKKRGSPMTPEELIRKLKLKGKENCTLVLTRYQEQPIVIICDDIIVTD